MSLSKFLGFVTAAAASTVAVAQQPAVVSPEPDTPTSLWAAESDSLTLYLLGSVHLLRESDFPLDPRFDRAFDESEMVLFETAVDSLHDAAVAARMLEVAMLPQGKTLDELVSEETFARTEAAAIRLGLDPGALLSLKPTFAAMMLAILDLERIGVSESGIDEYFHERATKRGVPIDYFETVDEQLDLLFDVTPEFDAQFLDLTLDQIDSTEAQWNELMEAWRHGDDESLNELLNAYTEQVPGLHERLITQRNRAWVERLGGWLQRDRDMLIVVGAAHLVGENGLVRLLEERGFRVRQL